MTTLHAGPPLEPPKNPVGRHTVLLTDPLRNNRTFSIECWYPAAEPNTAPADGAESVPDPAVYELLPGLGFTAEALEDAPALAGVHPVVIWSHGRTGTRFAYVMLCELLAGRGYVVLSPDHPGDTLADWLTNTAVDDASNETQRQGDIALVIDHLNDGSLLPDGIRADPARLAVAGHSYGGHTALAVGGAANADPRITAVAGLQSFTRTMRRSTIARIAVPLLMVTGAHDTTTPPATDADRAFGAASGPDARRVDVEAAGHQACSDVGLYIELLPSIENLPEFINDFVSSMADNITGAAGDPWRPTVQFHAQLLAAWLDDVLDRDRAAGRVEFTELVSQPRVTLTTAPR